MNFSSIRDVSDSYFWKADVLVHFTDRDFKKQEVGPEFGNLESWPISKKGGAYQMYTNFSRT